MAKIIYYPSKEFETECKNAISNHSDFVVVVPETSKIKRIMLQDLPTKLGYRGSNYSAIPKIINTIRLLPFYSTLATPLSLERYKVTFEDKGDLHINFVAKSV